MRLPDQLRTTQRLGDLLIETPSGWMPARQIAEIKETDGPNQILRENGRRRIVVSGNVEGKADTAAVVEAIQGELRELKLPEGAFATVEGTFKSQEQASRTIGMLSLVSLAMIFAILYSRYRSAVLALIVMGSLPLALIGAVAALWLAGQPLSVASMVGFITLTGIAARNGILKISHTINLALHEGVPWGRELVVRASLERLTPVLMTALSAGVALVPLMIDAGHAGQGNPASGRGDDLRRADQRDRARCVPDAGAAARVRPQADRAAASRPAGPKRSAELFRSSDHPNLLRRPNMKMRILVVA